MFESDNIVCEWLYFEYIDQLSFNQIQGKHEITINQLMLR